MPSANSLPVPVADFNAEFEAKLAAGRFVVFKGGLDPTLRNTGNAGSVVFRDYPEEIHQLNGMVLKGPPGYTTSDSRNRAQWVVFNGGLAFNSVLNEFDSLTDACRYYEDLGVGFPPGKGSIGDFLGSHRGPTGKRRPRNMEETVFDKWIVQATPRSDDTKRMALKEVIVWGNPESETARRYTYDYENFKKHVQRTRQDITDLENGEDKSTADEVLSKHNGNCRQAFFEMLDAVGGDVTQAAKQFGVSRRTAHRWLVKRKAAKGWGHSIAH
jgi:hypothetical protein